MAEKPPLSRKDLIIRYAISTRGLRTATAALGALAITSGAIYAADVQPAKQELAKKAALESPPPPPEALERANQVREKFLKEVRDPFLSYQISIVKDKVNNPNQAEAEATLKQRDDYLKKFNQLMQDSGYKAREQIVGSLAAASTFFSGLGFVSLLMGRIAGRDPGTENAQQSEARSQPS